MDGNCNIITEILLVTAKSNIITVTSYCPTLLTIYRDRPVDVCFYPVIKYSVTYVSVKLLLFVIADGHHTHDWVQIFMV